MCAEFSQKKSLCPCLLLGYNDFIFKLFEFWSRSYFV
jgi:hypothetical protein